MSKGAILSPAIFEAGVYAYVTGIGFHGVIVVSLPCTAYFHGSAYQNHVFTGNAKP